MPNTTAHPKETAPSSQDQPTLKILYYRLLDSLQSFIRLHRKELRESRKWGKQDWRNKTRQGRRFSRVECIEPVTATGKRRFLLRPEPGWEWHCPQCHEYSLIKESDMPGILKEWEEMAAKTIAHGFKPTLRPSGPSEIGCTNCRFRPGARE